MPNLSQEPMMVELKPCRHCGAECRVETFGGGVHVTPTDLWLCSNHKMFGGDCPSDLSYFTADAWNERNTECRITHPNPTES